VPLAKPQVEEVEPFSSAVNTPFEAFVSKSKATDGDTDGAPPL